MSTSKEQALAIKNHSRTLLVSAGAGAGKTRTLTERIIQILCRKKLVGCYRKASKTRPITKRMIQGLRRKKKPAVLCRMEDPVSLSRLLVVTFTRAAAEELRDRISSALCEALAKQPNNRHLAEQLLLLPSAPIRTIDSFCIDLVRRNADLLGLPSSFRPAESAELGLCFRSIMEEMLEEGYGGLLSYRGEPIPREDFEEMAHTLMPARREEELPDVLKKLYNDLQSYTEQCGLLLSIADDMARAEKSPLDNPWINSVTARAKEALAELHIALSHYRSEVPEGPKEVEYLAPTDEFLRILNAAKNAADYPSLRDILLSFTPLEKLPDLKKNLSDKAAVKSLQKAYAAAAEVFLDHKSEFLCAPEELPPIFRRMGRLHRTLGMLLSAFHERFFEKKKQLGLLDFSDTKQLAYALLYNEDGSRSEAALAVGQAYDEIYIDEYQDVNAVDHAIFEAIASPTNRFMVGDIKQSIYLFRGSDPSIFARLKSEYPLMDLEKPETLRKQGNAGRLILNKNYRSDAAVLHYINAVFHKVLEKAGGSIGYEPKDDLAPGKETAHADNHLPTNAFFFKDSSVRQIDYLASEIRRLTSGERKKVPDKRSDGKPPQEEDYLIKGKDILLLCTSNEAVQGLAAKFEQRGIPAVLADEKTFFFNAEIQLAVALLNVISNPQRDTHLAGVLCSPLYRFTLDEAIRMRRAHPKGPLIHAVRAWAKNEKEGARAREFLEDLDRFRLQAEGLAADRFLRILYRDTGLLATAGRGGKRRDNLLLLYNFARQFESTSFRGLYRFTHYVNEIIRTGASFSAPTTVDAENAVRIMTIHKSKGLQSPVVFVLLPSSAPSEDSDDMHPSLGLPLQPRDSSGLVPLNTPVRHAIQHENFVRHRDESIRLLYVALTRAAERLYVTSSLTSNYGKRDELHAYLKEHLSPYTIHRTSWFDWISATLPSEYAAEPILPTPTEDEEDSSPAKSGEELSPAESGGELSPAKSGEELSPAKSGGKSPPLPLSEEELRETLQKRFDWQYPHAAVTRVPGKLSVSLLHPDALSTEDGVAALKSKREREEKSPTVPRFRSDKDARRAAKAGTATHLFMQFCNYTRLSQNGAAAEVEALKKDGFLTPEDAALVNSEEAERFARSPFPAFLASADTVRREFRFHMSLPAKRIAALAARNAFGDETVLVQGVIDCLVHRGDEIILIDYKTDRLTPFELANPRLAAKKLWESHGEQMGYYAAAVHHIFGKYPSRCLLYSLPLGDAVEKNAKDCLQIAGLLEESPDET